MKNFCMMITMKKSKKVFEVFMIIIFLMIYHEKIIKICLIVIFQFLIWKMNFMFFFHTLWKINFIRYGYLCFNFEYLYQHQRNCQNKQITSKLYVSIFKINTFSTFIKTSRSHPIPSVKYRFQKYDSFLLLLHDLCSTLKLQQIGKKRKTIFPATCGSCG